MRGQPTARVVGFALRCYPRRWHRAEAAELAALLIADGVPARSIACSYLCAAARERVTPQPGHRLAAAAAALLIAAGSLGVPQGLLSAPASAASATRVHLPGPGPRSRCGGLGSQAVPPAPVALDQVRLTSLWARSANLPAADGHGEHC
jgi:hypothetical protein